MSDASARSTEVQDVMSATKTTSGRVTAHLSTKVTTAMSTSVARRSPKAAGRGLTPLTTAAIWLKALSLGLPVPRSCVAIASGRVAIPANAVARSWEVPQLVRLVLRP